MDPISKILQLFIKSKIDYIISYSNNKCEIKIDNKYTITSDYFNKKKESLNDVCVKILNILPKFVHEKVINLQGNFFKATMQINNQIFESKLFSKKKDAIGNILKTIICFYLNKWSLLNINEINIEKHVNVGEHLEIKEKIDEIKRWQTDNLKIIKEKLNILHINDNLITLAFIHSSFSFKYEDQIKKLLQTDECNYEKLEFLGDSILQYVVTKYLYNKYANEAILTQVRAKLVCRNACIYYMKILKLDMYILSNICKITLKIISNIFEAIIGAIYLTNNKTKNVEILMNKLISLIDVS